MFGNVILSFMLPVIIIIALSIFRAIFSLWSIIELIILSSKRSKDPQSSDIHANIKRVSISLPLGLNILGLIYFLTTLKPAIKNNYPKILKKANSLFWISFVIYNIILIGGIGAAFYITWNTGNIAGDYMVKNYNIQQQTQKDKKIVSEEGRFVVNMPCKNPIEQANSYICTNAENQTQSMVGYQDIAGKLSDLDKIPEKELFKQFTTGFNAATNNTFEVSNFSPINFKDMRGFNLSFKRGDNIEGKSILSFSQKNNNTIRIYMLASEWNSNNPMNEKFESFANSFEKL